MISTSRRKAMRRLAVASGMPLFAGLTLPPVMAAATGRSTSSRGSSATTNWTSYGADPASSKYSPLDQISAANFDTLEVAWTWRSPDEPIVAANDLKTWAWEVTPLAIDGVLYIITSLSQIAAVDALSGQTLWVHDSGTWRRGKPSNNGFVQRGVAYWADGDDRRILYGTNDAFLVCLDARTGKLVQGFGQGGRVDLTLGLGRAVDRTLYGVCSPPVVCRGVIVVGSRVTDLPKAAVMPPGDVRGFDVRTGRQRWAFHSVPHENESGHDTWADGSARTTGSANVWSMMSADEALGYVYLPFGTTANDHYGVRRPGAGLFGDSLVCLDATTGRRVWHFQMARHGLWDYDLPAAPNLIDIRVDGRPIEAVAQTSKQGFLYVFDRATGRPVWPIEDRAVPKSSVPGEAAEPTQPFPTRPAPFDRQGVTTNDVVDFTPAMHARALAALERYHYGPLYTPPMLGKPTIQLPGIAGGASWSGAACDPETGICYVSSITLPYAVELAASDVPGVGYYGKLKPIEPIEGVPLWKPPYGRLTAIDLNTGSHRWMTPVGDIAHSVESLRSLGLKDLGRPARGHLLLTKTLVIVGQEGSTQREGGPEGVPTFQTVTPSLAAFDKASGKPIAEVPLPRNATAAPMTFMLRGKQYLIVATGGGNLPAELIALRLP